MRRGNAFSNRSGLTSSSCSGTCPPGHYSLAGMEVCLKCGRGLIQVRALYTPRHTDTIRVYEMVYFVGISAQHTQKLTETDTHILPFVLY